MDMSKKVVPIDIIECSKRRDVRTGKIEETVVHYRPEFHGRNCVMVDDICDGGKTFIEIAKKLKEKNCGKIFLVVTHGIFSKGMSVFRGLIDEVHTPNGRIEEVQVLPTTHMGT